MHEHGKTYQPPADDPPRPAPRPCPLALRLAARLANDGGAYFNHDAQIMAWAQLIQDELEEEHPCPKI